MADDVHIGTRVCLTGYLPDYSCTGTVIDIDDYNYIAIKDAMAAMSTVLGQQAITAIGRSWRIKRPTLSTQQWSQNIAAAEDGHKRGMADA